MKAALVIIGGVVCLGWAIFHILSCCSTVDLRFQRERIYEKRINYNCIMHHYVAAFSESSLDMRVSHLSA
jgi:hypothetical protein